MIVAWDGRDWEWRPDEITVAMARKVKEFTRLGLRSWMRGIDEGDPDSLVALLWAIREQNGQTSPIETLEFSVPKFYIAIQEAAIREFSESVDKEVAAQGPKGKGRRTPAKTRTSAGTETSTSSS